MRVLRREWYEVARATEFTLVPLGDVHLGAAACNEKRLQATVDRIAQTEGCYWVGMGDYAEFINLRDPRFDMGNLADWVGRAELMDLAAAQVDRLITILGPIAGKCLGLAKGNHEDSIHRHTERDVYSEIVVRVKDAGGFPADHNLALGYYGWLTLMFYRTAKKAAGTTIRVNIHHGRTAGRQAGASALAMEKWLWTHDADLCLMGHNHRMLMEPVMVESLNAGDHLVQTMRRGAFTGGYLESVNEGGPSTYSEKGMYYPLPTGSIEVVLRPGAVEQRDRVRVVV